MLFSSFPDDLDLYDKPQARNVQLWTEWGELLLDGPHAHVGRHGIDPAKEAAILADWREAERRSAAMEPDSADATEASALVEALRNEYGRAFEAAQRDKETGSN